MHSRDTGQLAGEGHGTVFAPKDAVEDEESRHDAEYTRTGLDQTWVNSSELSNSDQTASYPQRRIEPTPMRMSFNA